MRYTFAELEFLLARSEGWPRIRSNLGLSTPESTPDVSAAGLASLLVRGLAAVEEGEVKVRGDVTELAGRLAESGLIVTLSRLQEGLAAGGAYLSTGDGSRRALASIIMPGVLELRPLSADQPAADQLAQVVVGVLEVDPSIVLLHRVDIESQPLIIANEPDGWKMGEGYLDQVVMAPATRLEIVQRIQATAA